MHEKNVYSKVLIILFVLFVVANLAYLHRVPGLFGDEGSEGENVYQLLRSERITVVGERSYIGPLIDYVRVPFVLLLGYNALALRLVMLLVSVVTFWLAAVVFRRLWGEEAALFALAFAFFSPTYLLYQRLGWAITLFPFFGLLLLFFLTDRRLTLPYRSALAGSAAGLGLQNYAVFLPTIVGVMGGWALRQAQGKWLGFQDLKQRVGVAFLFVLGFWAGFGTQFAVIQLLPEDQGEPAAVAALVWERVQALPTLLPQVLSGSAYVARYTGAALPGPVIGFVTLVLVLSVGLAAWFLPRRRVVWAWLFGLLLQLSVLLVMIDRFTLRYFVVFVLGVWALAGVGGYTLLRKSSWAPVVIAVLLVFWTGTTVLVPYLRDGGSAERFALGNRTDAAVDFVDIRGLLACVREAGPVWSDNPHIYNRLLFLSHADEQIDLPLDKNEAHWVIDYRLPGEESGTQCPELTYFRLTKRK